MSTSGFTIPVTKPARSLVHFSTSCVNLWSASTFMPEMLNTCKIKLNCHVLCKIIDIRISTKHKPILKPKLYQIFRTRTNINFSYPIYIQFSYKTIQLMYKTTVPLNRPTTYFQYQLPGNFKCSGSKQLRICLQTD